VNFLVRLTWYPKFNAMFAPIETTTRITDNVIFELENDRAIIAVVGIQNAIVLKNFLLKFKENNFLFVQKKDKLMKTMPRPSRVTYGKADSNAFCLN